MSHTLDDMEIASISDDGLKKLQDTEKSINSSGGTDQEEIYLMALKKQGR